MCFTDLRDASQVADGKQGGATSHPSHALHVQPHAANVNHDAGDKDSHDVQHSKYTTELKSTSQTVGEEQSYTFPSSSNRFQVKTHTNNQIIINQQDDHQNYKGSVRHVSVSILPNNFENIAGEGVITDVLNSCNILTTESDLVCNRITKTSEAGKHAQSQTDNIFDFADDGNTDVARSMRHFDITRNNKAEGIELINLDPDKSEESNCQDSLDTHKRMTLSKPVEQEPINQNRDSRDYIATGTSSFSKISRDSKENKQKDDFVSKRDDCRMLFDPS